MKKSTLLLIALAFMGLQSAQGQLLVSRSDLSKYTISNDTVLLHGIIVVFFILFAGSTIWLILTYRKHNRTIQNMSASEFEKESLIAKHGIMEEQLNEHQNSMFEVSKTNESYQKKLTDHKFELDRLINKIEVLESELNRKDEKVEELIKLNHSDLLPESKKDLDKLEINFRKLEKAKAMVDTGIISEKEFALIKTKVLSEL